MWGTQPQLNKNTVPVKTASLTDTPFNLDKWASKNTSPLLLKRQNQVCVSDEIHPKELEDIRNYDELENICNGGIQAATHLLPDVWYHPRFCIRLHILKALTHSPHDTKSLDSNKCWELLLERYCSPIYPELRNSTIKLYYLTKELG